MDFSGALGWFWMLGFAAVAGFLYQIVLELRGIRRQLEVYLKLGFPHIFDKH
jgi:hypothetical protein